MSTGKKKSAGEKIERVHCNVCGHKTKHTVVASRQQADSSLVSMDHGFEDIEVTYYTTWIMLECRGCGDVCLKCVEFFSEWNPGDEKVTFFPPPVSRKTPRWLEQLPEKMQKLLQEVYAALHADSRSLAMMGARAILDLYIVDRIGDVGTFREKLKAMEDKGHLSPHQVKLLDAALNAGHAAAHRGHIPSSDELAAAMDIVENLLQLDLLASSAKQLNESTPKRPPKQKKGSG
jgi:hypothetical protein